MSELQGWVVIVILAGIWWQLGPMSSHLIKVRKLP